LADGNYSGEHYRNTLRELQIELVKLQRELIAKERRVLVIVEGRDAAGKDGTIKRLTAHMAPRETRVFAPSKPTERERSSWYFQRFIPHLPTDGEFVIFNRSWYNRAGVERVMGFCTEIDLERFFNTVCDFERMLVRSRIEIRKYYLDVSRQEQKQRLADREKDPLKNWKISPIDAVAAKKWGAYTKARDEMFRRTHQDAAPWHVVNADHKKDARIALIGDLLSSFSYPKKRKKFISPDPMRVFPWESAAEEDGRLER
jgi:polyphosphate kinase 2